MERRMVLLIAALFALAFVGCREEQSHAGMDAGPAAAFRRWIAAVEVDDYRAMWNQLPITAKERFRYAWDDEREELKKATAEGRKRFMEAYGFSSWKEIENEEAEAFFVRSMGRYPKGKLPTKYQLLKKATIHKITYGDEGTSCIVTFLDEDGSPLPMRMKMLREGNDWKVVRLP